MALNVQDFITDGSYCACFNLRKVARAITQYYDYLLASTGLRSTQISMLAIIKHNEPITINTLAKLTITDRTTLTRNLKILCKSGHILIEEGEDRRKRVISITEKGSKALMESYTIWQKIQKNLIEEVGVERFERLLEDLEEVLKVVKSS